MFFGGDGYTPIIKDNLIKKKFKISKGKNQISFETFEVQHGQIKSTAYLFNKTAYISDCSGIKEKDLKRLKKIKLSNYRLFKI